MACELAARKPSSRPATHQTGLPAPKDSPSRDLPRPTRPYCLFVGRLEATKGLQDVCIAIRRRWPGGFWIAGAGSYEGELRRLAAGRNRPLPWFSTFANLQRLYREARVVVMPSLCYEVFPMVVLEAFREGAPIIARKRGPFPGDRRRERGRLLFDTAEDLRAALKSIFADDALRAQLSRRAVEAFHMNWTEAAGLGRYFGLIESSRWARDDGSRNRPRSRLDGLVRARERNPLGLAGPSVPSQQSA